MSQDVRRHIGKLAGEIGPRPAASAAERQAADYVSIELEQYADEVAVESFGGLTTFVWMYLVLFVLALFANFTFFTNPSLAFVASLAVIVFLNQEVNAKGFFFEIFPKRESENVIGVIEAAGEAKRRVVITTTLDTGKAGALFRPGARRNFRGVFQFFVAMLILQVTFTLLGLFVGPQLFVLVIVRLLGLVELAAIVLLLLHRYRGSYSPGANDNASGIAALLEVGKRLNAERLPDTEVWLVATGCGHATQSGTIAFLRRHWNEVKNDRFITLSHVGGGKLAYTLGEGILKTYAVEGELIDRARAVARAHPEWEVGEVINRNEPTDLVPLLAIGLRAIGIRGEAEDGFGVDAYTDDDTIDGVDDDAVDRAVALTIELTRAIGEKTPEEDQPDE
ncbi:MAG: M28 family peptidase [Chloroflexota bacterium]